jgi:hypothetical protein
LSEFYGVAIFAKKAFVGNLSKINVFMDTLKTNPRFVGRDVDFNEIFSDGISVVDIKDILEGTGTITEDKLSILFKEDVVVSIKELLKQNENKDFDLTTVVREYVLGSMIAYIEQEVITENVQMGEKNYRILVGAILLMMVNGDKVEAIRKKVEDADVLSDKTMSQLLNDSDIAKAILGMWNSKYMTIKLDKYSMNEENKAALSELIKVILIMDTTLPESDSLNFSIDVSIDGIKGILSAA